MPKGKKKGKSEHRKAEAAYSSEEESVNDNFSETSGQSDLKSVQDEAECEDNSEKIEEKVLEAVEMLNAKAHSSRTAALTALRTGLARRYLAPTLAAHRATLADHLARALRRGRATERQAAAALAPLLALQIGEEGAEEFVNEVRPALVAVITDKDAGVEVRTECCTSVAVLCYLLEEDLSIILELMRTFETIFSASYLKGDGSVKVAGAAVEQGALHAAALEGWALLLTLPAEHHAHALLLGGAQPPSLHQLAQLLEAASVEVRVAAGGALAVAHECAGEHEEAAAALAAALPRLQQLVRDHHKYQHRRQRKHQRATFRDILKYFEEGEVEEESMRVGGESVSVCGWGARAGWAALAGALGGGLQACAPHHRALRDALRLPAAPPPAPQARHLRPNKLQRHLQNAAAFKARTISRNKNRDKRSAVLAV